MEHVSCGLLDLLSRIPHIYHCSSRCPNHSSKMILKQINGLVVLRLATSKKPVFIPHRQPGHSHSNSMGASPTQNFSAVHQKVKQHEEDPQSIFLFLILTPNAFFQNQMSTKTIFRIRLSLEEEALEVYI